MVQCDGCDSILQVRYKENKNQITMDDPWWTSTNQKLQGNFGEIL